jgi:hypothetical protein
MTATDATQTWTLRSVPSNAQFVTWYSIGYGGGLFVAAGIGDRLVTSADGLTWVSRLVPQQNWWTSICYGNGTFVAVAGTGTNRVMTSS